MSGVACSRLVRFPFIPHPYIYKAGVHLPFWTKHRPQTPGPPAVNTCTELNQGLAATGVLSRFRFCFKLPSGTPHGTPQYSLRIHPIQYARWARDPSFGSSLPNNVKYLQILTSTYPTFCPSAPYWYYNQHETIIQAVTYCLRDDDW